MYKKIILCLTLSLLLAGFVAAQESNFKVSDGFKDVGDGVYIQYDNNNKPEVTLAVVEYTKHDAEDYFKNDTKYGYSVNESKNNTFNFIDSSLKEKGTCEIVKINGKLYIVESWISNSDSQKTFDDTFKNVMDFNKLNNVQSMNASEVMK